MTAGRRLGLLGGTFDPIHYGHLDAASAAATALDLEEILLIPAHDPPHRPKDPYATAFHRFALVALAISDRAGLRASDRELRRDGPSFTIDTLRTLHDEGWQASQLFFILGADAFADVAAWRSYPQVIDAANFVVIARPGVTIEQALARAPELHSRVRAPHASARDRASVLEGEENAGTTGIYLVEARTRDVSSTMIRERLAAHLGIDGLVPPAVARHIEAHHLYGAVDGLHGQDARISSH